MVKVGSFEMTDPQESFWEIVKYFDFLVSDFGYKTRRMEILRDCVLVSYIGPNNRLIEIGKDWNGDNNVSFRMKGFLGRSIINDERPMSIKNYAGFIGSRYFSKADTSSRTNLPAIPDLETRDEIFWSLYNSLYFLVQKHYSITRFEIGERICLEYRNRHDTIIVTTQKPYCTNWTICTKKWGITKDCQTISEYAEPKDIAKYITGAPILYEEYLANSVFSDTVLEQKDPQVYNKTLYTCPKCCCEVSFGEKDFRRYSLNKTSIFKDTFQNYDNGKRHSFLEFECPQCKKKTRVIFDEDFSSKEPVIKIDSVLVE